MIREPEWMEEVRQQMKKNPFYGQIDEELEQYKPVYLNMLETLEESPKRIIMQYVELLQKCEYYRIYTAFMKGMELEKSNQRARKNQYFQLITDHNALKEAVVMKTGDLLQTSPEFARHQAAFGELEERYYALLHTLPEDQRELIKAYQDGMADVYEIMFHVAAGFPKGIL